MKVLKTLCLIFIIPVFLSATCWLFLISNSPKSMTLSSNVRFPVLIERDSNNIPHIKASCISDALYALGYCMCQDRRWQLDIFRRYATGRLSEFFGPSTLELDKFFRNLKISESVKDDLESLSDSTKEITENFVRGLNDAAADEWLPLEYYLTNNKWENFTLNDIQSGVYFMATTLSTTWGTDILKVHLRKLLGEGIESLIPKDHEIMRPTTPIADNTEIPEQLKGPKEELIESDFDSVLELYSEMFDFGIGSNSWVISGKYTKSGKPILSSDPHMACSIPTAWYLNHITIGEEFKYGANIVGSPMSSIGRTKHISWGTTNFRGDDVDIYAEKAVNSSHYQYGEETLQFKEFEEIIKIKGQDPVKIIYKESIHGPILEGSLAGIQSATSGLSGKKPKNLAFCWAALGHKDKSLMFSHEWMDMRTFSDFQKLTSLTSAVRLTHTFASSSGEIGFITVGKFPVKSFKGDKILPGWKPETKWKGFIPASQMPFSLNPGKGFIVAANNFLTGDSYSYYESLGTNFLQARAERITELIELKIKENQKTSPLDQIEILKDELDVFARTSVPVLTQKVKKTKYLNELKDMQEWDFVMKTDSKVAAVYMKWVIQIARNLLKDKVDEKLEAEFLSTQGMKEVFRHYFQDYHPDLRQFCDYPRTGLVESCEDMIGNSFDEAVEFVGNRTWGELHLLRLSHFPFSNSDLLKGFFERSVSVGGNGNTVHATFTNWKQGFEVVSSAGLIFISDMGGEENYWGIETGMSGDVFSRFYSNLFEKYHNWELVPFGL